MLRFYLLRGPDSNCFWCFRQGFLTQNRRCFFNTGRLYHPPCQGLVPRPKKGLQFLPIFPVGRDRPVSQFREYYSSLFKRICQGELGVNFAGFRHQFRPPLSLDLSSKRTSSCSENSLFGFYRSALASQTLVLQATGRDYTPAI